MYEEPKFDAEGKFIKKIKTEEEINEKLQAPLKEGVLKVNCGLPLMFIVNKTDVITQSVDKKLYEENSEFILRHIRKTAISYGASIIYASGKSSCNLTLLYDYLCHCLFNFDILSQQDTIVLNYYNKVTQKNYSIFYSKNEFLIRRYKTQK